MTKVIVIVTDTFLYINFPVIYYFFLELAFGILLEINRSDHGQLKKIRICKYVEDLYIQALDIVPRRLVEDFMPNIDLPNRAFLFRRSHIDCYVDYI